MFIQHLILKECGHMGEITGPEPGSLTTTEQCMHEYRSDVIAFMKGLLWTLGVSGTVGGGSRAALSGISDIVVVPMITGSSSTAYISPLQSNSFKRPASLTGRPTHG